MLSLVKSSPLFLGKTYGKKVEANAFSLDINSINLPVRMWNYLRSSGVRDLSELLNLDPFDLNEIRNIGFKTIDNTKMAIIETLTEQYKSSEKRPADQCAGSPHENTPSTYLKDPSIPRQHLSLRRRRSLLLLANASGENIDTSLDIMEVSPFFPERVINFIRTSRGIKTIGDLLETDHWLYLKRHGIGKTTIQEVSSILKEIGEHPELFGIRDNKRHRHNTLSKYATILSFVIQRLDDRTKQILTRRFEQNQTLSEIGKELGLTRERIRQLINRFVRNIKLRVRPFEKQLKNEIINTLLDRPEPLSTTLFAKFDRINKNLFLRILVELYPSIPTVGNLPNYQEQRRNRLHVRLNASLEGLGNIYEEYTPEKLVSALGLSQRDEILTLFGTIFGSNKYSFLAKGGLYFLYRKDSLNEMAKAILRQAEEPMTIESILNIIRNDFGMVSKYGSHPAIISRIKQDREIFQLDRSLFGMAKHLSYPVDSWPDITKKIVEFLKREKRQLNIIEIMNEVIKYYPNLRSKYELVYIIRNDKEIFDLGFFNFCHKSLHLQERIKISSIVEEIFKRERRVLNVKEVHQLIQKRRFASWEGLYVLLKSQDYLTDYGKGFFGLSETGESNLVSLARNPDYLSRIITDIVYPNTNFGMIFENLPKLEPSKVRETIRSCQEFVVVGDFDSNESWVLVRRWSMQRALTCILCNGGNPMFKDEINWYLTKLDRRLEQPDVNRLSQFGIIDTGEKLELAQSPVIEADTDEITDAAFQYLADQGRTITLSDLLSHLNRFPDIKVPTMEELRYVVMNDDRFVLAGNEMVMLYE